jgi:hypothetical protein
MLLRQLAAIAALNVMVLAPLTAHAANTHQPPCALHAHRVVAVTPYKADRNIGKIRVKQLRGASLYVEAERHVSAEWLELELRRHLAAMRGAATMADCPLDLDGVHVRVDSRGPGFVVTLVAKDSSTAEEILRRARLLLA